MDSIAGPGGTSIEVSPSTLLLVDDEENLERHVEASARAFAALLGAL